MFVLSVRGVVDIGIAVAFATCRVNRRSQLGRWQLEQTAKLMMEVMRLNAKLVKGLKECRARGGPPRLRRCVCSRVSDSAFCVKYPT